MTGNKPVKSFKAGAISASVWENQIQVNGTTKNVLRATVQKRYKKKDGTWASTQSLSRDEVALAIYALSKCYDAMILEAQTDGDSEAVEE